MTNRQNLEHPSVNSKMATSSIRIKMVDLQTQYGRLKSEIDQAISAVISDSNFINGQAVQDFSADLANWLGSRFVIPCGNGTDALQLAYMALGLKPGDEVIVPAFNYVAAAEAAALLGIVPVFADVDSQSFNLDSLSAAAAIGPKTKAIVVVHLFGQSSKLEEIHSLCEKNGLFLIEDNAQAMGAEMTNGKFAGKKLGTIGDIGTTSFFPTKNLGCMGDGGALFCQDEELAIRIRMMANHGQRQRYQYDAIGMNSRLDTIQAAILRVKLPHLNFFNKVRQETADNYSLILKSRSGISVPEIAPGSSHVFHQYTIRFKDAGRRDEVRENLSLAGIQSMVYYPLPLHMHPVYRSPRHPEGSLPIAEKLSSQVLSLPIHSEMTEALVQEICSAI